MPFHSCRRQRPPLRHQPTSCYRTLRHSTPTGTYLAHSGSTALHVILAATSSEPHTIYTKLLHKLSLPAQVLHARRRVAKQVQELKGEIKKYMKSQNVTAKYAKEPFLTYALYAAIVLPLVLCLLPIYAISGEQYCKRITILCESRPVAVCCIPCSFHAISMQNPCNCLLILLGWTEYLPLRDACTSKL